MLYLPFKVHHHLGYIDVNVNTYIAFIGHGRTRHSQIPLVMKAPRCKTNAFQASFYNRIVKLWNTICKSAPVHGLSNISSFKQLLKQTYLTLFNASFDIDFPCTWTLSRDCSSRLTKMHAKALTCFNFINFHPLYTKFRIDIEHVILTNRMFFVFQIATFLAGNDVTNLPLKN